MNLWFNQNGDSSTGVPVMAGLPAPNATPEQIANDPGFLVPSALDDVTLPPLTPTIPNNGGPGTVPGGCGPGGCPPPKPPLFMTQRVSQTYRSPSPQSEGSTPAMIGPDGIAMISVPRGALVVRYGEYTGMQTKSLPPKYQIQWDDGSMSMVSRNEVQIEEPLLTAPPVSDPRPIEPVDVPAVETPVVLEPQPMSCGDKEIMIPVVDKCVDKTMALVFGAIALYLILNKDK
jgi:hypothetical protein